MNNKNLIIKTARRLDKFQMSDLVMITELDESEVEYIVSELISEQIIIKNNDNYFYNRKKLTPPSKLNNKHGKTSSNMPIINIENEDGYDYFLTLAETTRNKIKNYIEALNFITNAGWINTSRVLEIYNSHSNYKKVSYSTLNKIKNTYLKYGFKGILPPKQEHNIPLIPKEIYECFKKYYLNTNKLSACDSIYYAQQELQKQKKIEQPYAYVPATFLRKLRTEFTPEQIEYFRKTVKPLPDTSIVDNSYSLSNMLFENAADIYFRNLKSSNQLEKLMQQKTCYNNHLQEIFGNMKIKDIDSKVIAKYKQKEFDNGCSLNSVQHYVIIVKNIIKNICPDKNNLNDIKKCRNKSFAPSMNLLSENQIGELLNLAYDKYSWAYPIIYLTLSTGATVPELLALKWNNINFKNNTIFLKHFLYGEKLILNRGNSTMRTLVIDENISNLLKVRYDKIADIEEFVFKIDGIKVVQQYLEEKVLTQISEKLNIPKLFPSDLQHNFVNMCLRQNIPITFIQKSVGYYGITNFIKTYRTLIENTENKFYNPLRNLKTSL